MPPNTVENKILISTPAYKPRMPSLRAISISAFETVVPVGIIPVASRVFTTSIGVVAKEETALAKDPARR